MRIIDWLARQLVHRGMINSEVAHTLSFLSTRLFQVECYLYLEGASSATYETKIASTVSGQLADLYRRIYKLEHPSGCEK